VQVRRKLELYYGIRNYFPCSCEIRIWEISWTVRVKNEVVFKVKEIRGMLKTITRKKTNWFGRILRRKCLLKHVRRKTERNGRRDVINYGKISRKEADFGNYKGTH